MLGCPCEPSPLQIHQVLEEVQGHCHVTYPSRAQQRDGQEVRGSSSGCSNETKGAEMIDILMEVHVQGPAVWW